MSEPKEQPMTAVQKFREHFRWAPSPRKQDTLSREWDGRRFRDERLRDDDWTTH